jgi:hypothetical protein
MKVISGVAALKPGFVRVQCTFIVDVPIPQGIDDGLLRFMIEDNGCPATGTVGAVVMQEIVRCEAASVCWACNFQAENKILELNKEG